MVRRVNLLPSSRLFVTSLCVACCGIASAQSTDSLRLNPIQRSPFRVAQSFPLTPAPTSIAEGDLNGDGHPDMVVTRLGSGSVSVLLGNGKGGFSSGIDYPAGTTVSNALVADFNGDGNLDVAVTDSATGSIDVLFGNGDGTFGKAAVYAGVKNAIALAAGHFTGSGKVDLAVASSTGVSVLLNDGTGHFSSAAAIPVTSQPRSLAAADLKGAGHDDLILANQDGSVTVLLGDGAGHFSAQPNLAAAAGPLSSVIAADFNADGKADLAIAQANSNVVTILLGRGDGSFESGVNYTVGNGPAKIIAAGLTGGALDLVSINQLSNTFSVLVGNGDGTFKPSIDYVAGNLPLGVVAGDFNSDGHADLAIADSADQSLTVPLGHGDGTFVATRSYRAADLVSKSVAAGDLNGDARTDLVVSNYCGTDSACSSNGTATIFLANADGSYSAASTLALGNGPVAVALANLHGSQKLDLIALNSADKTLSIFPGNGDGTFGAPLFYSLSTSPRAVLVGDFNGDGNADLAIASDCGQSACTQPGTLDIWLGHGDGSLAASASYTLGFSPVSIAAADLRSTGHLDLVVANACGDDSTCKSAGTATLLFADGTGKFTQSGEIALGNSPSSIAIGNLSGSGLDLAVAERGSNQVAVLHADGKGGFGAPVAYTVGTAPYALAIADINGDGQPDLAVANSQSSNVSVLYGAGSGKLQSAINYPVSANPESLAVITSTPGHAASLVTTNGSGATPLGGGVTPLGGPGPTPSGTALTASPAASVVSQPVTLTAVVTGSGATPTGSVTFTVGTTDLTDCNGGTTDTVTLDGTGTAVCVTGLIPLGADTVTASYGGDTTYNVSSGTAAETVTQAATSTSVSTLGTPSTVNDQLTFTSTTQAVAPSVGTTPLSGNVNFSDSLGSFACTNVPVNPSNGTAQCIVSTATAGSHTITANYANDTNYGNSSGTVAQNVNQAATTAVLTSSKNPATTGDSVTYTLTVSTTGTQSVAFASAPTIAFKDGGSTVACTVAWNPATGVATCTPATVTGGSHSITATYTNDTNYANATSNTLTQNVTPAPTAVTVNSASPSAPTVDQMVIVTATVAGTNGSVGAFAGSIEFFNNTVAIPGCTILVNTVTGQAQCTISAGLTFGAHNITAQYLVGDPNYSASAVSTGLAVSAGQAATTAVVSASPTSVSLGQSVTLTATVSPNVTTAFVGIANTVAIGGSVAFTDAGTTISGCGTQSATFSSATGTATATCTTTTLTAGTHSNIVATYLGNTSYSASPASSPATVTVSKASTSLTVTANPAAPALNQAVTFTAAITFPSPLAVTPLSSGTVSFSDNGTTIAGCSAQTIAVTGTANIYQATCSDPSLSGGSHAILATYSGDTNYNSTLGNLSLSIASASSVTTITSSANPSTVNQSVSFTIDVQGGTSVKLTGTATVTADGTNSLGQCTLAGWSSATGIATCAVTSTALSKGNHTISASYSGDSNYSSSSGSLSTNQVVNAAGTSLALSSVPATTSSINESVTFTAIITAPAGSTALTGTVAFTDTPQGGTASALSGCSAVHPALTGTSGQNSTYSATCSTSSLVLGSHTVTATYGSDNNFSGSTMGEPFTVSAATSSIALASSSSGNTSTVNQSVTFTATIPIPSGNTALTGTVAFKDGASTIAGCVAVTPSTVGVATCSDSALTAGSQSIVATYSGDPNFSVSPGSLTQTVNKAGTSLAVSSSQNPSVLNQSVTFTATLTAPAGSVPITGTIGFTDTPQSGTAATISGCSAVAITLAQTSGQTATYTATCTTSTLVVLSHTITASFGPDPNFASSTGLLTQTVDATTSNITLSALPASNIAVNQPVTFTATIPSQVFAPQGKVTFTDNGLSNVIPGCSAVAPSSNWIATCSDPSLTSGAHTIVAQYAHDPNINVGNGTLTLQVGQATTTTVVTGTPNPAFPTSATGNPNNFQNSVTFTATVTAPTGAAIALTPATASTAGGSMTFSVNGTNIASCTQVIVTLTSPTSGTATCSTTTAAVGFTDGSNGIVASYSGDPNYATSSSLLSEVVEDFSLTVAPVPSTTQGVLVTHGFTTASDPFPQQALAVTPNSISYSGTLSLSCSSPTTGAPKCTTAQSSLSVAAAGAQQSVGVTIDATSATPGTYNFTLTGTDANGLVRTFAFPVTVRAVSALQIASGATTGNTQSVTFMVPSGVTLSGFTCPWLAGSGITATTGVPPSNFGVGCSFGTPAASGTTITLPVTVTTSGTIAALDSPHRSNLLLAGVLGIPFFGLIGLLRGRKRMARDIFRLVAILAIGMAALQAIGCGGSFHTNTTSVASGGTTPPGIYYLQVQGTGSDNNTYEAILQIDVLAL